MDPNTDKELTLTIVFILTIIVSGIVGYIMGRMDGKHGIKNSWWWR